MKPTSLLWPIAAFASLACSRSEPSSPRRADPPTAADIMSAGPCECDDVGACAMETIVVSDLACAVGPSGNIANCSFKRIADRGRETFGSTAEQPVSMVLERRGPQWCVADATR